MERKPVLGKGLASLFPGIAENTGQTNKAPAAPAAGTGATAAGTPTTTIQQELGNKDRHPGISMATLDEIHVNPYQPRREFDEAAIKELADSIKTNGIIQPLIVRKATQGNGYQLIAGERRLRAAKLAGLKQVPIVIRRSTDKESLEIALIENIQRQDLNCIDEALAYFQLMREFALTQEEAAERVGKDRATVANYLRLLRLPDQIIQDLKAGILSFGHGKALLGVDDLQLRLKARNEIVEKGLSVRDTEALVEILKAEAAKPAKEPSQSNEPVDLTPLTQRLLNLSNELTRQWSTKVEVKGSERRGKIILHYATRQDLDRIIEALQNEKIWAAQST